MKRAPLLSLTVASLALLLGLGVYAYLGTFSRYWADDYCYSAMVVEGGLWGALINFSQTLITSRYSAYLLMVFSEFLGPKTVRYLALTGIGLWLVGTTWVAIQLLRRMRFAYPRLTGCLLAATAVFFTILMAPNRFQSVYWRAAMVTYLGSLVMMVALVGYYLRVGMDTGQGTKYTGHYVIFFVLAVFAGGFSETLVATMLGGMGLLYALIRFRLWQADQNRERQLRLLESGLLGFGVALLLLFISPTNAYRREVLASRLDLLPLVFRSLQFSLDFMYESFKGLPIPFLVILITSGITAYSHSGFIDFLKWKRRLQPALLAIPLCGYFLVVCSFAPSVYGESAFPEGRSLIIARFVIVVMVMLWGIAAGGLLQTWKVKTGASRTPPGHAGQLVKVVMLILAMALLVASTLRYSWQAAQVIPEYQQRADAWDGRDVQIRNLAGKGVRNIEVKGMENLYDVYELSPEADLWVNRCAARYYGVETIRAIP